MAEFEPKEKGESCCRKVSKGAFTRDREGKTWIHPRQHQTLKQRKDTTADADIIVYNLLRYYKTPPSCYRVALAVVLTCACVLSIVNEKSDITIGSRLFASQNMDTEHKATGSV